MTPTLGQEAQTFFQQREQAAYAAYQDSISVMVGNDVTLLQWHASASLRTAWLGTHDDAVTASSATPCTHRLAERSHEAQRCSWCWMMSTYNRLITKENSDED